MLCSDRNGDPDATLDSLIRAHIRLSFEDPVIARPYLHDDPALTNADQRRIAHRKQEHVDRWADALRACQPDRTDREILIATHATINLLLSVPMWPHDVQAAADLEPRLHVLADGTLGFHAVRSAGSAR